MLFEQTESHRRIMNLMIEGAQRRPVRIVPSHPMVRARTDVPFCFAWLPKELYDKILHPLNYVGIPGNFAMPQDTSLEERKRIFRYVDDLIALRMVNRSFSVRFKHQACIQSIRWMMHAKPYTIDMHWVFAMHCTVCMAVTLAASAEAKGDVALQHLKTTLITRMMKETPRHMVQPTVDEVCSHRPKVVIHN